MIQSSRPSKKAPAGCLIPFGLIFLVAGLGVCWLAWVKMIRPTAKVRAWTETPCRVTQWEVEVKPGGDVYEVLPKIAYEYSYNGQPFTGQTYDAALATTPPLNDFEQQGAIARGTAAVCYVNPAQPSESSFRMGSYAVGGFVLGMGLLFAAVGSGTIALGLLTLVRRLTGQAATARPLARGCAGGFLMPIFCGLFAAAGFAVWKLALHDQPDWKSVTARMVEVPAQILASGVSTSRSSGKNGSTTYKAKIAFRYDFDGRTWHSGWLDFDRASTSSSNFRKAQDGASRHPAGGKVRAWVDPEAPWQAVLEKQGGTRWWLWLFPIIFGGIGVIGLSVWLLKLTALGTTLFTTTRGPGPEF